MKTKTRTVQVETPMQWNSKILTSDLENTALSGMARALAQGAPGAAGEAGTMDTVDGEAGGAGVCPVSLATW